MESCENLIRAPMRICWSTRLDAAENIVATWFCLYRLTFFLGGGFEELLRLPILTYLRMNETPEKAEGKCDCASIKLQS